MAIKKFNFGDNDRFTIEYDIKDFREFYDDKSENYDLDKVDELVQKLIEAHGWKPEFAVLDEAAKLRERTYYDEMKESFDELEDNLREGQTLWLCSNLDYCQDFTKSTARYWSDLYEQKLWDAEKNGSIEKIVDETFNLKLLEIALEAWPN